MKVAFVRILTFIFCLQSLLSAGFFFFTLYVFIVLLGLGFFDYHFVMPQFQHLRYYPLIPLIPYSFLAAFFWFLYLFFALKQRTKKVWNWSLVSFIVIPIALGFVFYYLWQPFIFDMSQETDAAMRNDTQANISIITGIFTANNGLYIVAVILLLLARKEFIVEESSKMRSALWIKRLVVVVGIISVIGLGYAYYRAFSNVDLGYAAISKKVNFTILKPTYLPYTYSQANAYALKTEKGKSYVRTVFGSDFLFIAKNHVKDVPEGIYAISQASTLEDADVPKYTTFPEQVTEERAMKTSDDKTGKYTISTSPKGNHMYDLVYKKKGVFVRVTGTTGISESELFKIAEGME